jgi:hypothetical protein
VRAGLVLLDLSTATVFATFGLRSVRRQSPETILEREAGQLVDRRRPAHLVCGGEQRTPVRAACVEGGRFLVVRVEGRRSIGFGGRGQVGAGAVGTGGSVRAKETRVAIAARAVKKARCGICDPPGKVEMVAECYTRLRAARLPNDDHSAKGDETRMG